MFDFNLPKDNTQIFQTVVDGSGNTLPIQIWKKPPAATMVSMVCIGPGAAGGAGFSATGSARGGGAGGGSGGITTTTIPAILLPDILYVFVGNGGTSTVVTLSSAVYVGSSASIQTIVCASGSIPSVNGTDGASSGAATGGAGETICTLANFPMMAIGMWQSTAGVTGGAGGSAAGANGGAGSGSPLLQVSAVTGGAGGGGGGVSGSSTGGSITGNSVLNANIFGGNASAGGNGDYFQKLLPLLFRGGAGGGGNLLDVGFIGGKGAYGCGGGGGGAGTTGAAGGRGGDGLIIITAW